MRGTLPPDTPYWKQFLWLGEQILNLPTVVAQCKFITDIIEQQSSVKATVWLLKPFYPLPGDSDSNLLDRECATPILKEVFETNQICFQTNEIIGDLSNSKIEPQIIAIPLLTNNNLLGVIELDRTTGAPFEKDEIDYLSGLCSYAAMSMEIFRQAAVKNFRSEQLSLVQSVSDKIANIIDLDDLCRIVTRLIQDSFDYYYVSIYTFEKGSQRLVFRANASVNKEQDLNPFYTVDLGEGIVGTVAQYGEEILASDVNHEPRYEFVDTLPETQSEFVLPLKVENKILGVLDIQSDQRNNFHEADIIVLRSLANNIALAVERAWLFGDLQKNVDRLAIVYEFSHALTSILDFDTLIQRIVELIQKRFGYPYVHIFSVHKGRKLITYEAGSGNRSAAMQEMEIIYDMDAPQGIIPWVARNGQKLLVTDVSTEPLFLPSALPPENTQSELTLPIMYAGEVLGILDIQSDQVNAFDDSICSIIEALNASIAIAFRNATLFRSEKWRVQVADSFRGVAGLVSANTAIGELLNIILRELERNLPCDASAIWLFEDADSEVEGSPPILKLAAVHGVEEKKLIVCMQDGDIRQWLDLSLAHKHPVIRGVNDPSGPLGTAMNLPVDYSSITAPLIAGGRHLGLLALAHHTAGRYGAESRTMTETFASYAAVAIQNARLFSEFQEQAWVSSELLEVAEIIQSVSSIDELMTNITRMLPLLIGVKKCAFYLWDEPGQCFIMNNWYGLDPQPEKTCFYANDAPALDTILQTQTNIPIHDIYRDLALPKASQGSEGSLLLMPILSRGNLLGAFLVEYQVQTQSGKKEAEEQILLVLQGIIHQVAVALENLLLEEAHSQEAYVTAVLLQVAQAVVALNDIDDILDTIVHLLPILVGIGTAVIYLWDKKEKSYLPTKVYSLVEAEQKILSKATFVEGEFELLDCAFDNGHPFFSPIISAKTTPEDWPSLVCHPIERSLTHADYEGWLYAYPLTIKKDSFGVLLIKEEGIFPAMQERRLEILQGIAQQIALAFQNDRFRLEMVETERIEREFQLARQIQQTFLPDTLPLISGWELDAIWQTALQVGGDFYDVFELPENKFGFVIADVADKGMPAALYMTVTRTLIRAFAQAETSPGIVLEKVNELLLSESQDSMFVTATYLILDPETGSLVYANAGHNPPLHIDSSTTNVNALPKGGIALGVLKDIHLQNHTLSLKHGDLVLMYTDGVTEALSSGEHLFGEKLLVKTVASYSGQHAHNLLKGLDESLNSFRQGVPPSDDVTMLVFRWLPEKIPPSLE